MIVSTLLCKMKSTDIHLLLFLACLRLANVVGEQDYCDASDPDCDTDHMFKKLRNKMVVAAIDFGTTYSGWAFQAKHQYRKDPTDIKTSKWGSNDILSKKTPTTVLIRPDGKTLEDFGYAAENKYLTLAADENHKEYYYFRRFKMMLYDKKNLNKDTMLKDDKGLELPAITVFSLAIGFLKDNLLDDLKKTDKAWTMEDIHWVLTVPAIWNDTAKQFMRKSAVAAGIENGDLTIALEPEAASLYCRMLPIEKQKDEKGTTFVNNFQPGRKYIVLDAGGGTVDMTIHEVMPGKILKELYTASGGPWGGTRVDEAFKEIISSIVGDEIYDAFKIECAYDHLELFRSFENIKRTVEPAKNDKLTFHFSQCLDILVKNRRGKGVKDLLSETIYKHDIEVKWGRVWFTAEMGRILFKQVTESIVKSVKSLLNEDSVRGTDTLLMVGGFSDSPMLQDAIRTAFSHVVNVFTPPNAELAIVQGAVNFGFQPATISARVARFTYGIRTMVPFDNTLHHTVKLFKHQGSDLCTDIFDRHVKVGTQIKYGTIQGSRSYVPLDEEQDQLKIVVVACETEQPFYVTDEGCYEIGDVTVDITNKNVPLMQRKFTVEFSFSDTEIKVTATEQITKKNQEIFLDFL